MSDEIEFVDGLIVKAPHERAPSFVKAQISIKVEDLGKWLREKYKAKQEWVNIDVKESRGGKWYAAVSTYNKDEKKDERSRPGGSQQRRRPNDQDEDDIPF